MPCSRRSLLQGLVVAGFGAAHPVAWTASARSRSALLFGNSRDASSALRTAASDARWMNTVLRELGFDTTLVVDGTQARMLDAIRTWLLVSSGASARLLYFAGHGAQYRGRNFLIPVDAELRSEDDLPGRTIDAGDLVDRMARDRDGVNLLVFDACRSMPMLQTPAGGLRGKGGVPPAPGLAPMTAPRGTLVAYSTAPGALSTDDPHHDNSPYTRHLAAQLRVPGLPIETVFKRARAEVLRDSGGTQTPWETSSLVGDVCLAGDDASCGVPAPSAPRTTPR